MIYRREWMYYWIALGAFIAFLILLAVFMAWVILEKRCFHLCKGLFSSKKDVELNTVDELDTKEDKETSSENGESNDTEDVEDEISMKRFNWKWKVFLGTCFFCLSWFCYALVAFDHFAFSWCFPVLTVILYLVFILCAACSENFKIYRSQRGHRGKYQWILYKVYLSVFDKAQNRSFFFFSVLFALLITNFSLMFFGEGVCITSTPDEFNTRFSRMFKTKYCDGVKPCHVYLTLSEDVSTSMFVNFHTEKWTTDSPMVYYDTVSHSDVNQMSDLNQYALNMNAKTHRTQNRDIDRGVHWALLNNLTPDTVYYFRVGYGNSLDTYSDEKSFLTGPVSGRYNFVVGGDISTTDLSMQVSTHAALTNPLFAVLGGDIEYGNGFVTCYWRLDHFLKNWADTMVTQSGRLIPMMLSIGNHEAGGFFAGFAEASPYFLNWFPQSVHHDHPDTLTTSVESDKRKTYHYHKISDTTSFYTLDSDVIHTTEPGSSQHTWLEESLQVNTSNQQYKFAVYHAPLYPSIRPYNQMVSVDLRNNWLPLFDKYNMTVAFENHDHAYKKTKLMRGDKVDPTGTLYTGDGSWGVPVRPVQITPDKEWYMETIQGKNYILSVEVFNSHLNISAIDENGIVFDNFVHNVVS